MLHELRTEACQEGRKLRVAHLARSHDELAMVDGAESADVSDDRNIVRRVGKNRRSALALHQSHICLIVKRAPAENAMPTEQPQISGLGYARRLTHRGYSVGRVVVRVVR